MKNKRKSRQDYKRIEKQLTALERRMIDELSEKLGRVQNISSADPSELLDIAADGELDYLSAVLAEAGAVTIEEIKQALQKLKDGTYGICEACGKRIPKRRLQVRPFATQCVKCKQRQERPGDTQRPAPLAARGDSGVTVDLTDEDAQASENLLDEVFRDIGDRELSELY